MTVHTGDCWPSPKWTRCTHAFWRNKTLNTLQAFNRHRGRLAQPPEVCVTTATQSLSPWQLRALKAQMEDDFARTLRMMSNGNANSGLTSDPRSESVQLEAALHDGAQDRLEAITAALRRFDMGTYGECARCANPISFGRLSVMPEATLCIACGAM